MIKVIPLNDRVVVEVKDNPFRKEDDLEIIEEDISQKPRFGRVISQAEGVEEDIKDKVVAFSAYGGTEIKDGDETYIIIPVDDLDGVVPDELL